MKNTNQTGKETKRIKLTALLLAVSLIGALLLSGCQSSTSGSSTAAASTAASAPASTAAAASASAAASTPAQVTTINVAFAQNGKPTGYTDDKGNITGYDIETLRLVNQLLPQYKFVYVGLDQTAVYAGLSTGKYQIAVTNSFWTQDRADKYLFPKENIGASILGIYSNKQAHPDIKALSDAATQKLSLTPILAGDGLYYVVDSYNKANPSNPVKLTATDDNNSFTEAFQWVAEGRYDFSVIPQQYWDSLVAANDGAYHQYVDKLSFNVFGAVKTWTILSKGEDQLAADLDKALAQLKQEGKLSELSKKFYNGVDNLSYLTADSK